MEPDGVWVVRADLDRETITLGYADRFDDLLGDRELTLCAETRLRADGRTADDVVGSRP